MSFQVTILKVLAGHPFGALALAELRRDVAILMSSGRDWTDRMKRLAARAPDLDIFGQGLVVRDIAGWRITDEGRQRLAFIEQMPDRLSAQPAFEVEPVVSLPPVEVPPLTGTAARRDRRRERRSAQDYASRSAVA